MGRGHPLPEGEGFTLQRPAWTASAVDVRHARRRIARAGHRVRIYVPFGQQWYEYSVRRLQENPAIAGYVAADTLGRFFGR